ncbi:MFS general substrate transporter [Lindgomyces ingoldianus]|uniref:MFS general substrate transporter n=1 Tax=Lindgomyces ingoldianus TaxID=673940 RepID=A0ACB6QDZ1_9PLEO|nr:MFS general substrate transporter [Lindgomyces ingoldianus]KAF2465136.1 MFS general substrate transporter [Lindgomyces ingoldianus]
MSVPIPQNPDPEQFHDLEKLSSIVNSQDIHGSDRDSIHSTDHDEISRTPSQRQNSHKSLGTAISRVFSARSNASLQDPGPPPDKGIKAWTQAFMGHLVVFNTWGLIASFGVFQTHYTSNLGLNPSAVSWIGSMQMLGHFFFGMFSGRALDAGHFHWVVIPGVFLAALGMFMASLSSQYYQFFLAQGVLTGLGCGLQFTPAMSLVTTYFSKNRSVAVAIVASGSATGGMVYPSIARQLLPKIGFPWTVRVMGFLMLAVGALYLLGVFLVTLGQFFAFYYVGTYGIDVIGVSYSTSVNLLMIMNGLGLIGRLIPSYFADLKFGPHNTLIPFAFISAIVIYCWSAVRTVNGLYAFSITYGLFTAGFQGLFPSTLSSLTKDLSKVGVRNGMGFAVTGIATLIGPPISGALIQRNGGIYFTAQMWAGSMIVAGSVVLIIGRISRTGWVLRARV